jgi:fibronectin type 3 domain-containing protein
LSWSPNGETDLLGYKIYRSNFISAEFSEINHSTLPLTAYTDSINVKTLSTKVFYKLAAFDTRMNRSAYSTVVEVELPDVIPPLPPTIKDIRPQPNAIFLAWNPSTSNDVASYELQRRPNDTLQWRPIRNFTAKDSSFYSDKSVSGTASYQYQIVAIDKSKLKSLPSNAVWGKALPNNSRPSIENFSAQVDRENKSITLQWRYGEKDVAKYLIYRAAGDEPMTLYKSVSGESESFVDVSLKMNTDYQFRIKCVFTDGSEGLYSSVKKMKY